MENKYARPAVRGRAAIVSTPTAHNEQQLLRRGQAAPPGYEKPQSGLRPLCGFSPPQFLCAGIATQFLHRAQKTSVALLLSDIKTGVIWLPISVVALLKPDYIGSKTRSQEELVQ
jgi:hypothetical protein